MGRTRPTWPSGSVATLVATNPSTQGVCHQRATAPAEGWVAEVWRRCVLCEDAACRSPPRRRPPGRPDCPAPLGTRQPPARRAGPTRQDPAAGRRGRAQHRGRRPHRRDPPDRGGLSSPLPARWAGGPARDRPRSGRPQTVRRTRRAEIPAATLNPPPPGLGSPTGRPGCWPASSVSATTPSPASGANTASSRGGPRRLQGLGCRVDRALSEDHLSGPMLAIQPRSGP
jgi:hypothetical protein